MNIISSERLDTICANLVSDARYYSLGILPLIECLYATGLRVNEAFNLSRWSYDGRSSFNVELLKNSGTRNILLSDLPRSFVDVAINYPKTNYFFRVRQLEYFIKNSLPEGKIFCKNKEVTTHLFRYNKCRSLQAEGLAVRDIRSYIHHSSDAVTMGYLFNDLYTLP